MSFSAAALAEAPTLTSTAVLSKLDSPWDMAFLPDGTMFFTEKCKGVSVRLPSGTVNKLLCAKGGAGYADMADELFCKGQAGVSGIAIDPDFAKNRYI